MRAAITHTEIAATYTIARLRENGVLSHAQAINRLTTEFGMKRSSATYYIDAYRHMREGKVFKLTINADAASYFLRSIRTDFGYQAAKMALSALRLHIEHRESQGTSRSVALRKIYEKFNIELSESEDHLLTMLHILEQDVVELMKAPAALRKAKLPEIGHKVKSISVATKVYIRNAAVIAEVLLRADGFCEVCKMPAPFVKRSNDQPYLEVHHRIRLADGGDDAVANALAVCPNCHRQAHYG